MQSNDVISTFFKSHTKITIYDSKVYLCNSGYKCALIECKNTNIYFLLMTWGSKAALLSIKRDLKTGGETDMLILYAKKTLQ